MVSVAADQFELLNVPPNGWSFWLAVSRQLDTSGKGKNIQFGEMGTAAGHNIRETANQAAQGLAEDIAEYIRTANPPGVRDAIDAILKREGKAKTVDEYLTELATPVNPGNLDEGPQAVPDPAVFVPLVSAERNDIKLTLYQPSGGADGMYTPTIRAGSDASPRDLHILYKGPTDYAILLPKAPLKAAAPAAAAAAAAAADAVAPAAPEPRRSGRVANAITNARALGINAKEEGKPLSARAKAAGKLSRAMRSAAGRLSATSLKDAKARLGKAAKATRRLVITGNYVGEVIIAGERVRLNEENFNPDKFYDVVSFHDKYFPHKIITDLEKEKETFGRVFGDGAPVAPGTDAPSLPCEPRDADILLDGLKSRFEGLRKETVLLYEQVGETVDVRARIDHIQKLKIFIDGLERAKRDGTCVDFQDLSAVTEKDVQTEEEIRTLLRQFAFMILQARSPVPEYADRTRIVQDFIEELRRDPVSEEEMNAYLILWKEQAMARGGAADSMPTILGEVLDTTSTQRGLLDMMLEDKLEALYNKIVEAVRVDYSVPGVPPSLLEEFNRYILEEITTKGTSISPQERVIAIVKKTVSMNLKCWQDLKTSESLVESRQAEITTLQDYLGKAELKLEEYAAKETAAAQEKEGFLEQLKNLTGENAALKVDLEAKGKAAAEAAEAAAKEIEGLNTTIGAMHSDLAALDVQLRAAVKEREELEARAISALEAEDALRALLETERTEHEGLKERYTALKEEHEALKVKAADTGNKLLAAQAALKGAQAEVERLSAGASQSAQDAAEKEKRIAELLTQLAGLNANVAALKAEKEGVEGQLEACSAALEAEGQKFRALTEEKLAAGEEATKRIGEAEGAAAEAGVKMRSAQAAAALSAAQIKNNMDRIRDLQAEVTSARDQLREANETVARIQGEIAAGDVAAAAKVDTAMKKVQEAQERLEALQKACEDAKSVADAALADRDAQIKKLQEDLTAAAAREAATAASLAEAQKALEKKVDEMNIAATKAAEGLDAANGKGAAAAAALGAELEQLKAAVATGQKELAGVTAAKVACEEALAAAKASVIEAGRREAAATGREEKFKDGVLKSLKGLAQNVLEGNMQGPDGVDAALGPAFQTLLKNIREANEKAMAAGLASGAASNPDAKFSTATQVCFMTHFITFFVKTLFFTQDKPDMRYDLFQKLDSFVDSLIAAYKSADTKEGDDKHILYKMLATAFSLIYAGETLYVNKQTISGLDANNYIGLQVIKQVGPSGEPDTARADLVKLLWDTWAAVPSVRELKVNSIKPAVETVFGQILLLVPKVHFNPPIKPIAVEGGFTTTDSLQLLHAYPSLTFLPTEIIDPAVKMHENFTEVDVDAGFTMKKHNILAQIPTGVPGAKAAEIAWPGAVRAVMNNDTLSFADMFCIFVVLGRRYLMSIRDDLTRFKCPLPAFLADPEGARGALKADRAAFEKIKKGEDAEAAAAREAAAAEAVRKEEAEAAARKVAEADAARKAKEIELAAAAARRAQEAAAAAARKAQEEAAAAAAAAAAPPSPFGQNLPLPKTAGGGIKSNIETFMAIFNRVNTGSTLTPTDILSDIKVHGDKKVQREDEYPILSFIKTYGTFSDLYRAISFRQVGGDPPEKQIQTAMQSLVAALNDRLRARQVVPASTPSQSTGGSVNFLRKFLLRFIDSYIHQYKIEGRVTVSDKFVDVYPEFKQCFNINIQVLNPNNPPRPKEITRTLFDELQIGDAMVQSLVEHDGTFDRKYKDIAKDIVVPSVNENRIRFIGGQPAK
jgi:hypothetical protein